MGGPIRAREGGDGGGEHNGFEINQCVMTLLMGHNLTENQNVFLYLRREVNYSHKSGKCNKFLKTIPINPESIIKKVP